MDLLAELHLHIIEFWGGDTLLLNLQGSTALHRTSQQQSPLSTTIGASFDFWGWMSAMHPLWNHKTALSSYIHSLSYGPLMQHILVLNLKWLTVISASLIFPLNGSGRKFIWFDLIMKLCFCNLYSLALLKECLTGFGVISKSKLINDSIVFISLYYIS